MVEGDITQAGSSLLALYRVWPSAFCSGCIMREEPSFFSGLGLARDEEVEVWGTQRREAEYEIQSFCFPLPPI